MLNQGKSLCRQGGDRASRHRQCHRRYPRRDWIRKDHPFVPRFNVPLDPTDSRALFAEVPQFLLNSRISTDRPRICVTQPRRVAATTLATRVSAEVGCSLGAAVGYTVRFDDRSTPKTRLKYMTDGALLAEMLGDRDLERYEVVVLDEAHERSLRTDMLMGFLKQVQARRLEKVKAWEEERKGKGKAVGADEGTEGMPTPLKIVIMSATIDAKRFSDFFDK